jgi:Cupin domain
MMTLAPGVSTGKVGQEKVRLKEGDVLLIPAWMPHRFTNKARKPAAIFNVYAPPEYPPRHERITSRGQDWRGIVPRRCAVELRIKEFCHRRIFVGDPDRLFQPRLAQFSQGLFEQTRAEAAVAIFH